jgi:tripartite-type tricarboxylate transporter receptor subunit TctC
VWWGLFGPSGLPQPIVKRLNTELNAVLVTPEIKDLLTREGAIAQPGSPEALGSLVQGDLARWTSLIKTEHIQTE